MSDPDKVVDRANADRECWIIKVPEYVAKVWNEADDMSNVGVLRTYANPTNAKQTKEILYVKNLEEGLNGLGVEQRPSRAPPSTLIVSAETDGSRLRLEGQQKRRLDLQPQRNERYRQYIQERRATVEQKKEVVMIDETANKSFRPTIGQTVEEGREEKRRRVESRRDRIPAEELRGKLFGLFSKHEYYSFNDLASLTEQPREYLKTITSVLCQPGTGVNRAKLMLRPEFRISH